MKHGGEQSGKKSSSTRATEPNTSEVKERNAWPQVMKSHKFIGGRGPG